MAYNEIPASNYSSGFNPCSVSLDIRTPEELAAVNEFLLVLGRDVSGVTTRSFPASPNFSTDSYFDPSNLSQLGLVGMPGIPSTMSDTPYNYSHRNSYHAGRQSHASLPTQYGNMYDLPDPLGGYSQTMDCGRRPSKLAAVSPFPTQYHHQRPTPPLDSSPHSTVSTPSVTATPPQLSMSDTFDILRPSRADPVAHLAAPVYMTKSMRQMIPLKSALPERPPQPIEPKLPIALHRSRPPLPTTGSSGSIASSKTGSGQLYPLLASGDAQYKLPPLGKMYTSSSHPPSRDSSPSSSASPSPHLQPTVLPSIHSIRDYDDEFRLSSQVGSIELERSSGQRPSSGVSPEDRKRHAEFILNLMVAINKNFKNQARDIEMDSP